ncbi:MAG TPA: thymidine kinase [Lacunisphaera sp.]|nr:thymidine kinase [Lacunisphaera sp.]
MSKLYFYYSAMNAGKSTVLLQASYNYHERGMRTLLFIPAIDTRAGTGRVKSRIGLEAEAQVLQADENIYEIVKAAHGAKAGALGAAQPVACVLVDEAQFLTRKQVEQLTDITDLLRVPVLCYGLRTDFQANLFPGSASLLALADNLIELKTICHCGRKATMNLRIGSDGRAVKEGAQVEIGGNDCYVAMCRHHFKEALAL